MKPFIVGLAIILLYTTLYVFDVDYRDNRYFLKDLKYVCEEVSISGALFLETEEYKEGRIIFNQSEAIAAIENQMKILLKLDDEFNPLPGSYWTDKITYDVYFLDDSNTIFPTTFVDPDTNYTAAITMPTVVVTINAGDGRSMLSSLNSTTDNIRSASHTWEGR